MRNAPSSDLESSSAQPEPLPERGLRGEALHCHEQARCFAGRPEEALFIRLAGAFEELSSASSDGRQQGS